MENNKKYFIVLNTDGCRVEPWPSEDIAETFREIIDGWLENVHPRGLSEPYCMIVDEEGKMKNKDANMIASRLYNRGYPMGIWEYIVGTVIIAKEGFVDGERDWVGLEEGEVFEMLMKFLYL